MRGALLLSPGRLRLRQRGLISRLQLPLNADLVLRGPPLPFIQTSNRRAFSSIPQGPNENINSDEKINAVLEHVRQRMHSGMEFTVILQVIDMLVDAGKWQKLMVLVADMTAHGLEPNEDIYRLMITACGHLAQWNEALQFFEDMMSLKLAPSQDNYATAIIAWSKLGRFDKSAEIFGGLRKSSSPPTLVVYHAMLTALLRVEEPILALAFSLLEQCRTAELQPSPVMYWQIMQVASQGGNNVEVVALYKDLRMYAPGVRLPNDSLYVTVMHALHVVGNQDTLLQDLFLEMKNLRNSPPLAPAIPTGMHGSLFELTFPVEALSNLPTTLTFNIAISSSIANRNYLKALNLSTQIMRMDRIQADEVTYNLSIDASRQSGNVKRCFEIKDTMSQLGIVPTMQTYTMLLDQSGEFWCDYSPDRLRQLVDEFRALWGTQLDARGHAVIVEAFAANMMVEDMMKAFNGTPVEFRTIQVFTAVMMAYSKLVADDPAQIDMVLSLLARAEKEGHKPAGYTLSVAMHGCALARRWIDFQALKERLNAVEGYLSSKAFSALLTQCKQTQNWELMVEGFENMIPHDTVLAFPQYDAILIAYRKLGRRKEGFALFESLLERFGRRDIPVTTFTTVICFSMDEGDVDQAVRLLRLMECPDAYAYQGVIGICIREKQLVRAADLIFDMVEEGLKPSETTFNLTLAGLVLAEVKERSTALRLIRLLPECRMLPQTWFNLMVSTKDVVEHQDFIRALLDEAIKMETKDPTARHRVIYKAIQVARTYNMTFMVTRLLKRAGELKIDIDIKTKNQLFSHMLKRGEWKLATEICNVTRPATGAQLADLLRMSTEDGSVSCAPVLVRELIKFGHKTLSPELIGLLFGKIEFPSGLTVARRIKTLLKGAKVAILPAVYMSLINRLMAAESSKPQCRALADELCSDIERASGDMSSPDLLNFLVRTRYKCRQWKKGDALYERLLRGSVSLETHTCEVIMNAQSLQRNLKEALSLFEHMRTHGPMLSPTVYSLLVAMCANNGDLKRAHELRREMQSQGVPLQWKAHAALLHCGIDDRATFRMLWADAILSLDDGDPLTLQRQERHSKSLPSLDERNETVGSAVNKMLLAFEQFNKEVGPVERDKYAHHLRGMGSIFDRLLMTETGAVSDDCIEPTAKFKAFENPR